jgi:hypothetical protein
MNHRHWLVSLGMLAACASAPPKMTATPTTFASEDEDVWLTEHCDLKAYAAITPPFDSAGVTKTIASAGGNFVELIYGAPAVSAKIFACSERPVWFRENRYTPLPDAI